MNKLMYKVGPKTVGFGDQKVRFVARPFYAPKLSHRDLLRSVTDNYSGLTQGQVFSVCDAVANEFRNHLFMGHPVHFMGLGTFRVSFDSISKESPADVHADDISHTRILFTPEIDLLDNLKKNTEFIEYIP